jgi:hypothetical protein
MVNYIVIRHLVSYEQQGGLLKEEYDDNRAQARKAKRIFISLITGHLNAVNMCYTRFLESNT